MPITRQKPTTMDLVQHIFNEQNIDSQIAHYLSHNERMNICFNV